MSKKIILFLSDYREGSTEKSYKAPDGAEYKGTQTNEAPVRYLLHRYDNVREIICLVTSQARESAWSLFYNAIHKEYPGVIFYDVPYSEGNSFVQETLQQIMKHVTKADEVILETTGGFRNVIMEMLLLTRVLSYSGIRTIGACYSNFSGGRVEDVSHIVDMFDLVGGMQEFSSFGSVRMLDEYFYASEDKKTKDLLQTAQNLREAIALCRTGQIETCMKEFNEALENAKESEDPLLRQLLPAFRNRFGTRMSTPGLIKWCMQSDMLQQAVTIYTERIPAYILEPQRHLLEADRNIKIPKCSSYEDPSAVLFMRDFLMLADKGVLGSGLLAGSTEYTSCVYALTVENLPSLIARSGYTIHCPMEQMQQICRDYLYVKMVRNMINHANNEGTPEKAELLEYLYGYGYTQLENLTTESLVGTLSQALDNMKTRPRNTRERRQ